MAKIVGPYCVVAVTPTPATIDVDNVHDIVSIDRVTIDPRRPATRNQPRLPEAPQPDTNTDDRRYTVDRIVSHNDTPDGRVCKVRWIGYGPEETTDASATELPQHFVARYDARVRNRRFSHRRNLTVEPARRSSRRRHHA